jgi:UDP-N-acetyl-D-galactosamine dehydrogenase
LNIALFNELAVIFDRMNIRSSDVFDAAATKWNFHRYYPGLVGGHCIPVDPYYMTYASSELGYDARVVLAGRDMNERMAEFIADKISGLIRSITGAQAKSSVLLLGLAFKPNVSDLRNSKVMALANLLLERDLILDVYDPVVQHRLPDGIEYRMLENPFLSNKAYDAVILAVPHDIFMDQKNRIVELVNSGGLVVDLVSGLNQSYVESFGKIYWSL